MALFHLLTFSLQAEANPQKLSPVEVVGTRTDRSLALASPSISLYQEADFLERQWNSLTEAIQAMPGTALAKSGQEGALASLFSRGTNSDHTAVYLNQRKLNPGFSGLYGLGQISLAGATQLEFHRGAASTLWGNESIGGVINIRTETFSGENNPGLALVEAGSFSTLNATVNQKFKFGNLRGNAAISRQSTDNDLPNHQLDQWSGQLYLKHDWSEQWAADLQVFGYNSAIGLPGNRKSSGFPQLNDFQKDETWMVSPGLTFLPNDNQKWRGFYSHSQKDLRGLTTSSFGASLNDYETLSDQLDLQWDLSANDFLLITSGLTYQNQDFYQVDLNQPASSPPVTDNNWHSFSAYSQVQWTPHPDWSWIGGVRYDDYFDFDSPWTGKISLAFNPQSGPWTLFAEAASAYAIPQAFDIFGPFGNPDLNAEESDSLEVGVKFLPADLPWNFSAVVFHNDLHNLIDFTPQFTTENIGKAETQGLESRFQWNPNERTKLWVQYTYLHAVNLDEDTRLARRPSHAIQAGIQSALTDSLQIGLEMRSALDREDVDGGTFLPIDMEDYSVVRLTGSYDFPQSPFSATLRIENVLDKQYDSVDGFSGRSFGAFAGLRTTW